VRDLRPKSAESWRLLGDLELRAGQPDSAIARYREAAALEDGDWSAWWGIAQAAERAQRPDEAIAACRAALARRDDLAEVHEALARLLALDGLHLEEAEAHARRARDLSRGRAARP
jgi:tetratricopeptide (TPR) repeat protein